MARTLKTALGELLGWTIALVLFAAAIGLAIRVLLLVSGVGAIRW
jgi:hypothetical protein